jgi:hypothetical protein
MKNNTLIVLIMLVLMLTIVACGQKLTDVEVTPTNTSTSAVDFTTTNTPTLKPTKTPTPTELPQTEVSDLPLTERFGELPESVAKIFRENGKFVYADDNEYYLRDSLVRGAEYTIESFQPYISEQTEHPEEWTAVLDSFTIIDLDRDGKNEVVCYIKSVMHLQADYLILSDVDGKACGYIVPYRGFNPLLADGRVWSSGGAASSELYRFNEFTADGYVTETLAKSDMIYYDTADGYGGSEPYFELAGSRATQEQVSIFCNEVCIHSSNAPWTPFDSANNSK